MEETQALVKSNIVMPAVSTDEAVRAFAEYQNLAQKIQTKDDIQIIQGKEFRKKSFWRKMERFFNVSLELKDERKEAREKEIVYFFVYRAVAPNGAYVDSTGSCSNMEKGRINTEHNTRATAETRAKNRAISDLVAFGEVTAEEMIQDENGKMTVDEVRDALGAEDVHPTITEKQAKRLFAIAKSKNLSTDDIKGIVGGHGFQKSIDITVDKYDKIIAEIEAI